MIYIETPYKIPYEIFALEYWLATEKCFEDDVFLLWNTYPTMVIGKFQNPYEEVNMDYVRRHNIVISRRLSGGGTMYIDHGGLQFTFITKDVKEGISFDRFVQPVVDALRKLGTEDVSFSGRNDILVCGKKVSGNSQYKKGDYTVHHGTLLFNTDLEQVLHSTTVDEHKITSKSIKSVRERVTNISEHMSQEMTIEEFKSALIREIVGDGEIYVLTEDDLAAIQKLSDEWLSTKEFIYGSTPKFEINKTGYFKGGKVTAGLTVDHAKIKDVFISGDFFGTITVEELRETLVGLDYDKEAVKKALQNMKGEIMNVSKEELLELFF